MKTPFLFPGLLVASLLSLNTLQAQIIRSFELDRFNRGDSAVIRNGDIVDINATLRLQLDKTRIAEETRTFANVPVADVTTLAELRNLLRNELDILRLLNTHPEEPDVEGLGTLADLMLEYLANIEDSPLLRDYYNQASARYDVQYPRTRDRASRVGKGEIPGRDAFIFMEFSKLAAQLARQAAEALPEGDVQFRLAGFIRTAQGSRAIKLGDEFDTFEGQFYTVPRWEVSLSEEGKNTLNEISVLADSLNATLKDKSFNVKAWLKTGIYSGNCLQTLPELFNEVIESVETAIPAKAAEIKKVLLRPVQLAAGLTGSLNQIQTDNRDLSQAGLLLSFNNDLAQTIDSISLLLDMLDEDLLRALDIDSAEPLIQKATNTLSDCRDNLEKDLANLRKMGHTLSQIFGGAQVAAQSAEIIGDEVRRLPIDLVPALSLIDLRNTGYRVNGDQIVIKAVLEKEENGKKVQKTVDQLLFNLQQIGLYSLVKPMLILADPLTDNVNVQLRSRFQFAPSYSLLFKWGSRRSKAFNQFWSPGFGINFAASDFNLDGVPEFGAALEFTALRDYLAGGLGFNFGADASYYFLGFRLPIASVPLPVFNNVDIRE